MRSLTASPRRAASFRTRRFFVPAALPVLVLATVALGAPGCAPKGRPGGGFAMPPMPVEVSPVHSQVVRDQFRALGSIGSDATIEVVAEIAAKVTALPFEEGRPIAANGLIARLDDRELQAEYARAAAEREQAFSDLERAQKLYAESAIAQKSLDDARTAASVADAGYLLARARFEKATLRAPFAGLAGRKRVSTGAYVRSGDVITDLTRVDEMKVTFAAPERYAGTLKAGVPVEVSVPAFPGFGFAGRVTAVDPVINPQTRTMQVLARLPNRGGRLRPGMSADVAVTFSQRTRALVVPDEAVFAEGSQSFVYRVKADSTVEKTAVTLGTRDSMHVEVTDGLSAGETVVRAGHQKLFPGARVMPIPEGGIPAGGPGAGGPKGGDAKGAGQARATGARTK